MAQQQVPVKGHYRKIGGKWVLVNPHLRELRTAKGIPDRKSFPAFPEFTGSAEYVVQEHRAHRAGKHFDFRIGLGDRAFSWAGRKLPEPGQKVLMIEQPVHTRRYMQFQGDIPRGQYGSGRVRTHDKGEIEIIESGKDKILFNRYHGKRTHEYVFIRTKGKSWLLLNRTTVAGQEEYPKGAKPKYKNESYDADIAGKEGVLQPKLDGAHAVVLLKSGKRPRVFSYRESKRGDPLEYTHKIKGLFTKRVPKGTNKVLRAEIYLAGKDGRPLPAQRTAGVLNAGVLKARRMQEGTGGLRVMPFDIVGSSEPYASRLAELSRLSKLLPFETPQTESTLAGKRRLIEQIRKKKHPMTSEGVIHWSPEGVPTKAKVTEDRDVYVHSVFAGKGKHEGRAGGITYKTSPKGEAVGRVGTGMTDEQREQLWKNREKLQGRVFSITHSHKLPSGKSFAPRFLRWHPDK